MGSRWGVQLDGLASEKGVEAAAAEADRTTLDSRSVRRASEVPGLLGLSGTDSSRAVPHGAPWH